MPLPPAIGTCAISGQCLLDDGSPNSGAIVFTSTTPLLDTTDHAVVAPGAYAGKLASDGTFSVTVPFNDNPGVTPTGWSYLVTEAIVGGRTFYVQVPRSLGATVSYDQLAAAPIPSGPVFPQPWIPVTVIQSKGDLVAGSAAGAVVHVPVGADGLVLTAASGQPGGVAWTAAAGGGAVASVNGHTGVVVLTASDVSALAAAQNLSDLASAGTARTNLGLGGSATRNVGTTAGTVAAGDDSRIVGAIQSATFSRDQHTSKFGLLLEPFPAECINTIAPGLGLVSGNLYGQLARPTARVPLAAIGMWLCSAGSGPTGSSYVALLDEAGNELGVSVDMTSYLTNVANEGKFIEIPLVAQTAALDLDTGYYPAALANLSSIPRIAGCLSSVPSHVDMASVTPAVAAYYIVGLPA